MLQGMHQKVAQNATGQGTKSGTAGLSGGCDHDMDQKGIE